MIIFIGFEILGSIVFVGSSISSVSEFELKEFHRESIEAERGFD